MIQIIIDIGKNIDKEIFFCEINVNAYEKVSIDRVYPVGKITSKNKKILLLKKSLFLGKYIIEYKDKRFKCTIPINLESLTQKNWSKYNYDTSNLSNQNSITIEVWYRNLNDNTTGNAITIDNHELKNKCLICDNSLDNTLTCIKYDGISKNKRVLKNSPDFDNQKHIDDFNEKFLEKFGRQNQDNIPYLENSLILEQNKTSLNIPKLETTDWNNIIYKFYPKSMMTLNNYQSYIDLETRKQNVFKLCNHCKNMIHSIQQSNENIEVLPIILTGITATGKTCLIASLFKSTFDDKKIFTIYENCNYFNSQNIIDSNMININNSYQTGVFNSTTVSPKQIPFVISVTKQDIQKTKKYFLFKDLSGELFNDTEEISTNSNLAPQLEASNIIITISWEQIISRDVIEIDSWDNYINPQEDIRKKPNKMLEKILELIEHYENDNKNNNKFKNRKIAIIFTKCDIVSNNNNISNNYISNFFDVCNDLFIDGNLKNRNIISYITFRILDDYLKENNCNLQSWISKLDSANIEFFYTGITQPNENSPQRRLINIDNLVEWLGGF